MRVPFGDVYAASFSRSSQELPNRSSSADTPGGAKPANLERSARLEFDPAAGTLGFAELGAAGLILDRQRGVRFLNGLRYRRRSGVDGLRVLRCAALARELVLMIVHN